MTRIAAACALLVFAVAVIGGMEADNTFVTTVSRALMAMAGTFAIGLVVGAMAQKMMEENRKFLQEKSKNSEAKASNDR